ncbi:dTDP-4-dehydrorhamnose reductase [Streptomyces sp. WAC05374]|nr:dTDP-4-dehydrorhamnose reductase [Streptomyces sp. WAC05374]RST11222.1 dTDP-4-dehydrorhamnose reductase [Streptomyces sp. WAC05374]TDF44418.1 dTDP-4-dehydrorhamnose reductase [Streptomyces sp. WAC05374]TDF44990.1 dTDP-4-dehydrorhamnose reductase [Streptomyces sp. WAC05374]TDF58485.1 dTDP-4-dehydrorhamnose reductase [Streptomyces sp. WAC05374]
MSWVVTGAGGMLGRDVLALLGDGAVGLTRRELDVTDRGAVLAALRALRPSAVVNCAAWTAVDDAESREAEALAVNGTAVRHLAEACALVGSALVHVSTDYVFDGHARVPYAEGAVPGPRTAYGRTKLAGERAVLELLPERGYVVRTAWLYGAGGGNFVRTMIRLAASRPSVDVVDDQRGQPTWSADVARLLVALVGAPPGVYHATNGGDGTWYDLARETFRLLGADPGRVRPATSASFPRPAPRPAYSVLGHARWREAGLPPPRDWREALAEGFPAVRRAASG